MVTLIEFQPNCLHYFCSFTRFAVAFTESMKEKAQTQWVRAPFVLDVSWGSESHFH
jgi:hypothetical protein